MIAPARYVVGLCAAFAALAACRATRDVAAIPAGHCGRAVQVLPPPSGTLYHGLFPGGSDGYEADIRPAQVESYERAVGRRALWVYFSHNWFAGSAFPQQTAAWVRARGAVPFIRLMLRSKGAEPNADEPERNDPVYSLAAINAGRFDSELASWGRAARAFGTPLLVEFGTEVNGDWFFWNARYNGREPRRFVEAYRRIVEQVRDVGGACNVTWVLHLQCGDHPDADWNRAERYFPGAAWVDWIGVSQYGTLFPDRPRPLTLRQGLDVCVPRLARLGLPLALLEFGSARLPVNTPVSAALPAERWAEQALTDLLALRWPAIRAFSWWNERWPNGAGRPATDMTVEGAGLAPVFRAAFARRPARLATSIHYGAR